MSQEDLLVTFNHDILIECLSQQLSELELFQTMYSPKEILITDPAVIEYIKKFVAKETDYLPNHLDYTIIQYIDNIKLELSIHLPSMYPEEAPDIYVRCNQLNGQQEKCLNTELSKYLESKHVNEVCVFTAISWLQDNAERFLKENPTPVTTKHIKPVDTNENFCRYWIYSHHIYSKKKIEEIINYAKEMQLTGFCLVGKPGVMCIEGNEEDCKEWWKHIKSLNWQKITLRLTEDFNSDERQKQQKFKSFEVLKFSSPSGSHSNMGSFHKYMEKCGLLTQATEIIGLSPSS